MPGVNALLLGSRLYRSGLVPRVIQALELGGERAGRPRCVVMCGHGAANTSMKETNR
jgi:hypothetical protein